jgi:2-polyprenyl-6-methoxyphenol hydroxylase-like FAD-dependent oxidoreductase
MSVCDEHDNELFRDDLSRILFSASSELVTYVFGDEVVSARQQSDCVDVELGNGGERSFDLLVGGDGLHSGVA